MFNGLIDALAGTGGAGEVGTAGIDGVTGGDVQTVLGSLKTILDTKSASADMAAALSLKSDKSVTNLHFKSVTLNANTGVFTFTREDGSFVTIDTVLEKVATNWQYDAGTQSLVLTLADGTAQSVPLSAFITESEFEDSAQIAFSVSGHKVTATVKAGSITDAMLSSALIAQLQGYVSAASGSAAEAAQSATAAEGYKDAAAESAAAASSSASNASASETNAAASASAANTSADGAASSASAASGSASSAAFSASDAEAWAVGKRNGADVESTDPAYHNNAKYYKEQAGEIVGGDFVTRTEAAQAVSGLQPKIKTDTVSLTTTWSGAGHYTQTVSVTGATANSKIDLQPTAAQLQQLMDDGVTALYIENNAGTLTAYAIGAAATTAMTIQCTITEVSA